MCEILVIAHDKTNPNDTVKDAKLYKRGDVVVVVEDGHPWGDKDRSLALFRIVKLPNVTPSEASMWLGREPETNPRQPSRMLQRRLWTLDLTLLPPTFVTDDARTEHAATLSLNFAAIQARAMRKTPRVDPSILGPTDPNVF